MKRTLVVLTAISIATLCPAFGDYALPGAKERLVLLLEAKAIKLNKDVLSITVNKVERKFKVNRFWMQDRIWSDGICTGVDKSSPKSADARVREVELVVANKKESMVLVELVCIAGTTDFIVTYLKVFDSKTEYPRYFPKKTAFYDTIAMPFKNIPKDAKGFAEELTKATVRAKERLAKVGTQEKPNVK